MCITHGASNLPCVVKVKKSVFLSFRRFEINRHDYFKDYFAEKYNYNSIISTIQKSYQRRMSSSDPQIP